MLAIHQDVQDEVYKEIWEIFRDSDSDITQKNLPNLRYLEMVIKETLRLFPTAPVLQRQTDVQLELGKGRIRLLTRQVRYATLMYAYSMMNVLGCVRVLINVFVCRCLVYTIYMQAWRTVT